jgi:hypothetical protein
MRPSLRVVKTKLELPFWTTHDWDPKLGCQDPRCRKDYPHGHNNNWQSVLKRLVEDEDRNRQIAREIVSERGHVHLVPSGQLKHLNLIRRALIDEGWDGPIYHIRGEENARGDSQKIVKAIQAGGTWEPPPEARKVTAKKIAKLKAEAEAAGKEFIDPNERPWVQVAPIGEYGHEAVILSTVANEGMDVPPIDRTHMCFPIRQAAATIQQIGRGERIWPGKRDSVIVDYHDERTTVFDEQHHERVRTYSYQGILGEVVREREAA